MKNDTQYYTKAWLEIQMGLEGNYYYLYYASLFPQEISSIFTLVSQLVPIHSAFKEK